MECMLCGTVYKSYDELNVHYRNCNIHGPWNCLFCGKSYSGGVGKVSMIRHYNTHKDQLKRKQNQPNSKTLIESAQLKHLYNESLKSSSKSGKDTFEKTKVTI